MATSASPVVPYTSPDGKTAGYLAAKAASDAFLGASASLEEIALSANERTQEVQVEAGIDTSKIANRFGTTAAVVRINGSTAELLQVGDSIIIVVDVNGNATVPLGYFDHDIVAMRKWRQFADEGVQNIREHVWNEIVRQREAANSEYGVLNGDDRLKTISTR